MDWPNRDRQTDQSPRSTYRLPLGAWLASHHLPVESSGSALRRENLNRAKDSGAALFGIGRERFRLQRGRGHACAGVFSKPRAAMLGAAEDINLFEHPIGYGSQRGLAITRIPGVGSSGGLVFEADLTEKIVVRRYGHVGGQMAAQFGAQRIVVVIYSDEDPAND